MLDVDVSGGDLHFGASVTVRFLRTLRAPKGGPPHQGPIELDVSPLFRVDDYADRVPISWRKSGGAFIPVLEHEALWIDFSAREWKPNAVKVGIGRLNALSGKPWNETLSANPQDYLVVPDQPCLKRVNTGRGFIEPLVALPLDKDSGEGGPRMRSQDSICVRLLVFEPKPAFFPDRPPQQEMEQQWNRDSEPSGHEAAPMAGHQTRQMIFPDDYGVDTWDLGNCGKIDIHLVNSLAFHEITGSPPACDSRLGIPVSSGTAAK